MKGDEMPQILLVPRSAMEKMPWWTELSPSEQRQVLLETQSLTEELDKFGLSKLAIGEHLVKLRDILEPKKKFVSYLKHNFPEAFSRATAYRWIDNYQTATNTLPAPFVEVAMSQGYHVIDAEMVEKNPPPRTHDKAKIVAYLKKIKEEGKKAAKESAGDRDDPEDVKKELFNYGCIRIARLPNNSRTRANAIVEVAGLWFSYFGIQNEQAVSPLDVPEGLRAVRGRPRLA